MGRRNRVDMASVELAYLVDSIEIHPTILHRKAIEAGRLVFNYDQGEWKDQAMEVLYEEVTGIPLWRDFSDFSLV